MAAVLACLFAASSCSSDKEPSAKASSVPSYANNTGTKGAEQFVGYWVDELNKATLTGKTAKFKSLAFSTCSRCTDFATQLDAIYGAGGHVETTGWKIDVMVPETGLPKGETGMSVKLKVAPQTVYKKKGATAEKHPGGELRIRLLLTRPAGVWRVTTFDIG